MRRRGVGGYWQVIVAGIEGLPTHALLFHYPRLLSLHTSPSFLAASFDLNPAKELPLFFFRSVSSKFGVLFFALFQSFLTHVSSFSENRKRCIIIYHRGDVGNFYALMNSRRQNGPQRL